MAATSATVRTSVLTDGLASESVNMDLSWIR